MVSSVIRGSMKKIVLLISVMVMSVSSFGASGQAQLQGLGSLNDLIDLIDDFNDFKDIIEERRGERRRRLIVERYSIPVRRGEILREDSVIPIRRALRAQGVRLDGKAIRSVTLRAKSRHGRGRVALQVGRFDSRRKRIDGDRRLFRRRGSRTFHTIHLEAPLSVKEQLARGGVRGRVRLNIRGNVKVRSVEVEVVRRR